MAKITKEDLDKAQADLAAQQNVVPWGAVSPQDVAASYSNDPFAGISGKPAPTAQMGGDTPKVVPWGAPGSGGTAKEVGTSLASDPFAGYFKPSTPKPGAEPVMFKGGAPSPSYPADFGLSKGGVIPAHTIKTVSGAQEKEGADVIEQQKQAALAKNQAEQNTANVEAQERIGLAGFRQGQAIEAQKAEAWRQSQINQHLERQQQLMDDIRSEKIDPNKRFKEEGIGGFRAAAATIAQALGSVGASLTGGPNLAKEIVDRTLEKDFQAQIENLNTKKAMLGEQRSLLGQKMAQFGDQRTAEAAMRADAYAGMQALAESNIQYAKTDEQKAAGQELAAHFADKSAEWNRATNKYVQAQAAGADPRLKQISDMAAKLQEKYPGANPEDLRQRAAAVLGIIPGAGLKPLEGDDEKLNAAAQALIAKGVDPARARQLAAAGEGRIAATGLEAAKGVGGRDKGLPSAQLTQISKAQNVIALIDKEIALRKGEGKYASMKDADKRQLSKNNLSSLATDIAAYQIGGVPDKESVKEKHDLLPSAHNTPGDYANAVNPLAGDPIQTLLAQRAQAQEMIANIEKTATKPRGIESGDPTPEE